MSIDLAYALYKSSPDKRRDIIIRYLNKYRLKPSIQKFESPFGFGYNIIIEGPKGKVKEIIITAHYDGNGIFDNIGGVVALLKLVVIIKNKSLNYSFKFVFTDQEEKFQQGARYFVVNNCLLKNQDASHLYQHINIDGFGVGNCIVATKNQFNGIICDNYFYNFLYDNDIFKNYGIETLHIFSCFSDDAKSVENQNYFGSNFLKYLEENWCLVNYKESCELLLNKIRLIFKNSELNNRPFITI